MSGFTNQGVQNPDLWGLLNLMADPEKYKEKLTEISAVEKRLEAKIALAGHADQILTLRETAAKNHETAIAKLTAAENRAAEITKAAEERARANLEEATAQIEETKKLAQKCLEDGRTEANTIITQASAKAKEQEAKILQFQTEVYKQEKAVKERAAYYDGLIASNETLLAQNSAEQERLATLIAVTEQLRQEAIEKDKTHQEAFALFLDEHSQAYERYAAIKKATDEQ